jgi:hypothetical protein
VGLTTEDPDAAFDRARRLPHQNRALLANWPRTRPLLPPLGDRQASERKHLTLTSASKHQRNNLKTTQKSHVKPQPRENPLQTRLLAWRIPPHQPAILLTETPKLTKESESEPNHAPSNSLKTSILRTTSLFSIFCSDTMPVNQ